MQKKLEKHGKNVVYLNDRRVIVKVGFFGERDMKKKNRKNKSILLRIIVEYLERKPDSAFGIQGAVC